jgi:Asp-tRNA(Asn)/Glu-tRNA(Gln) amidotransferase A subunit family amidase
MMGLPGLALPAGLVDGAPVSVRPVGGRFREEPCLRAGAIIECAAAFPALDPLAPA